MPPPRLRFDEKGCYYHAYNRIAGPPDDYLFGDIEKEKLFSLIKELSEYYVLEPLSFVAMSNHYHCVIFAPSKDVEISDREIKSRWMKRYGKKLKKGKIIEPRWKSRSVMKRFKKNMRNISEFIGRLQWTFTMWFKRSRPEGKDRRGSLWAGRYKNTVLDSGRALWKCIQYVELNPLRAKMVRDLRDYRFSSFGEYCGKGTHPFAENITKHLCGEGRRFDSLEAFMTRLQEIFCAVSNIIFRDEINPDDKELVTLARRCRYWCDSGIIGSEIFVREVMSRFYDEKAAARRRLTQFTSGIFSLRQLKTK